MALSCPLSFEKIDATIARINSLWIALFLVAYFFTNSLLILLLLSVDFIIRIYGKKEYSPFVLLSTYTKNSFQLKSHFTDSGAKRLAAQFGLLFVSLLAVTQALHTEVIQFGIYTIFISCVLLELFFNYCIGCKVYFILQKLRFT